jgi:hypothetical protein
VTGSTNAPKYQHVCVRLVGADGNAFAILGMVGKALRRAGIDKSEIDAFYAEATRGDYDDLLATCMRWVEVE